MNFFSVPFKRIPGVSPLVVDSDLQVAVATDGGDQVEHAITVPGGLSNSQLVVMIIAPEQLGGIEEGANLFEVKVDGESVEDGEGATLYGYAYVLAAPAAGVHTVQLTFADACTPASLLVVLSDVLADSGVGSSKEPGTPDLSIVPIVPPSDYTVCIDFIAAVAPAAFVAIHGQTVRAAADDVLSAAASSKPDLNAGVSQISAWRISPSSNLVMHLALIFQAAGTTVDPEDPDPPEEISDIAIWLLNEPSGAVAEDSVGDADGVITGSMEYGLDDLIAGADTCMAGDGIAAKIIAPHDESHELATYTLDFYAQADSELTGGDVVIPGQEDWTNHGTKIAPSTAPASDSNLSGALSPACIVKKGSTYFMFYIGADGTRTTAPGNDGGPRHRSVHVATATDPSGTWTKYASNPIITYRPNPGHANNQEEGIFGVQVLVDPDGNFHALWVGNAAVSDTEVSAQIFYSTSTDGLTWANNAAGSAVLAMGHAEAWADHAGDELSLTGFYRHSASAWWAYIVGQSPVITSDQTFVLATTPNGWDPANDEADAFPHAGNPFGTGGQQTHSIINRGGANLDIITVSFNTGRTATRLVRRTLNPADPANPVTDPSTFYQWNDGRYQAAVFLDLDEGLWIIAAREGENADTTNPIFVMTAPVEITGNAQEAWLSKDLSGVGERPPGGISIERVWNGSAARLAAYTRNAGAVATWIEDGATPDAQHGVANWPAEEAVHIHLAVEPAHETEPTRLYLDGTKVATSINTQGLQTTEVDWSMFCYRNNPTTFSSFADGMIYRVRLRDLPLSDAEVAAEVAGEPAVSITHGAAPPAADYDGAVAAFDDDLVSYWKFQNNGVDENGTQTAVITGSPEFNVETIVDIDRIAEGAPADGTCLAWPGSAGTYAEAAHNASHKTAAGTIVVTFQRDTAAIKSTLVAADRATGGTSSGPGGFSIEVETTGAPRCFLRNSAGSAIVVLGTAGDVVVNEAYTAVFKWGVGGLSFAIWNAAGSLVRRLTNALETGLSGTSPIRFGSWHTAGAEHDGPFGRVVWLDRRISDVEEADLARARTIVHGGGVEEPPPPTGPYTPFPFVQQWKPPDNHSGVAARPGYSASNPRNASFIDPMSGLEVFRITPNRGANILINGTTDSGLNCPAHLKGNNNVHADRCWNADGTLLMLTDSKERSSDPSNPCRSALIDVDGNHGNSGPWRFLRAAGTAGLGDAGVANTNHMWDPANPLRAYVFKADGMYEWWPAGAPGHGVGSQNKLYNWPSGFTGMDIPQDHPCQASYDGAFWMVPCRRNSDGARGGYRLNLATGAAGPFRANPLQVDDNSRDIAGTSPNGIDGYFNHTVTNDVKYTRRVVMTTGALSGQHTAAQRLGEHPELFTRNGVTHLLGGGNGNWGALRYTDLTMFNMASASGVSVSHVSCRAYKDLWETIGGGTATSGLRYAMIVVSSPSSLKGIAGLRLDFGDSEQWRYLCHHRANRTENASEVHPMPDPYFSKVYFNSNWCAPGVETDVAHINTYICLIPDAWRSPNNSGA